MKSDMNHNKTKDQEWIRERLNAVNAQYPTYLALQEIGVELSNQDNDESIFCPFHDNTQSPAARYYAKSGSENSHLYCFVCKKRWYGFDIYIRKHKYQFLEAIQKLERRFGIQVRRKDESTQIKSRDERSLSPEWDNIERVLEIIERKIRNSISKASFHEFIQICKEVDIIEYEYKKSLGDVREQVSCLVKIKERLDMIISREEVCL